MMDCEGKRDLLVAPNRRMVNPFLQCSLKMRYAFRATPKPHLLAEVVPTLPADRALSAGNSHFEGNSIANVEIGYMGADGHDHARGFMT